MKRQQARQAEEARLGTLSLEELTDERSALLSSLEKNSTDKFFISSKLLAIAKNLQGKRNF